MKQFTMYLQDFQRPVIHLANWHKVNALIDTGALFPVWTEDEKLLELYGGVCVKTDVPLSGLGGQVFGNLYVVPNVIIGELIFANMHIIAYKVKQPGHILLPATIFQNLIYEIDSKNHRFNVSIPDDESNIRNLVLKEENGKVHVLCTSA